MKKTIIALTIMFAFTACNYRPAHPNQNLNDSTKVDSLHVDSLHVDSVKVDSTK